MMVLGGLNVTVSVHATERVGPHWPVKARSKRLHKKMEKKRGPQFTTKPAAFKTPMGLVVHPAIYAELQRATHPEDQP